MGSRSGSPAGTAPVISDRAIDRLRDAAAWPDLDARYEISGVAGHGGMGTVYVARDRVLDRDVAVKVLDVADQKGSRAARLRREADILAGAREEERQAAERARPVAATIRITSARASASPSEAILGRSSSVRPPGSTIAPA